MQFLYPNVFYMMLLPLILLIILVLTSKENIEQYFSKEILDKLAVGGQTIDKTTRNGLMFFTLILFIIALGRPVIEEKEQELQQNLIPIVVALDVSKSMLASDIFPNRITLAKEKLKQIIKESKNATIGILLFAKDSYILSPVTEDFLSLQYIVDNLDTNINFNNGSNIFATLETTSFMLEDFQVKNLIILSDGGNDNEYTQELAFAKEKNIAIYSIGMATKKGAVIPEGNGYLTNKEGDIVTVKLNESIKNLSLQSGGGYIDFSLDSSDVKAIINRINIQSQKEDLTTQKIKTYTELFYYPLALGLLVLLFSLSSFPKKVLTLLFVSFAVFSPNQSYAYSFEFEKIKKANKLYEEKNYKESAAVYQELSNTAQSQYNYANALYKDKKYQEAIEAYGKIQTEDTNLQANKLHNIGNSYVQQNDLQKAKEFYEEALKIKEDTQTKENLDIVNKELEKQKQENKKKDEKKDQKKNKEKNKENQKNKEDQQNQNEKKEEKDKQNKEQKDKQKKEKSEKKDDKDTKQSKAQNRQEKQKDIISDMEEKKWMKQLNEQKTPILLRKANTQKESTNEQSEAW